MRHQQGQTLRGAAQGDIELSPSCLRIAEMLPVARRHHDMRKLQTFSLMYGADRFGRNGRTTMRPASCYLRKPFVRRSIASKLDRIVILTEMVDLDSSECLVVLGECAQRREETPNALMVGLL